MVKLILAIAMTAFLAHSSFSANRNLASISFTNSGVEYMFYDNQPNLSLNAVAEICKAGVWITYGGSNYTEGYRGVNILPDFGDTCHAPTYSPHSARHIGIRNEYTSPSVTLFNEYNFTGTARTFSDYISDVSFDAKSIVTTATHVEFFSRRDFEGESVCYEIPAASCRRSVCWERATRVSDLPYNTYPRSARAGCRLMPSDNVQQ